MENKIEKTVFVFDGREITNAEFLAILKKGYIIVFESLEGDRDNKKGVRKIKVRVESVRDMSHEMKYVLQHIQELIRREEMEKKKKEEQSRKTQKTKYSNVEKDFQSWLEKGGVFVDPVTQTVYTRAIEIQDEKSNNDNEPSLSNIEKVFNKKQKVQPINGQQPKDEEDVEVSM